MTTVIGLCLTGVLSWAGVLLRRLLGDPALQGTTHVVVDEVHERSADSDLLLLLLRDLLAAGANQQLRVVLMSATAEAGLFQTYFDAELARVRSCLPFSKQLLFSSCICNSLPFLVCYAHAAKVLHNRCRHSFLRIASRKVQRAPERN